MREPGDHYRPLSRSIADIPSGTRDQKVEG